MGVHEVVEMVRDLTVLGGASATVVAGGVAVYRKTLRPRVQKFFDRLNSALDKVERLDEVWTKNGGSSFADSVLRTESVVQTLAAQYAAFTYSYRRPVYTTDALGEWMQVNRALEDCVGVSGAALTGRGWYALVHEDDRDQVIEDWQHAIADRRRWLREFRVVCANGQMRRVRVEATPMFTAAPTAALIGWFGVVTEVSCN